MSRLRYWRHLLFGGGGLGLAGAAGFGLLYGEMHLARRAIPAPTGAPDAAGVYGADDPGGPGTTVRLAMLGDSSASGVGCELREETPGAQLASLLADRGYRVTLDVLAVSGSTSADLEPQVSRCLLTPPDLAVVCIGANDITHFVPVEQAVLLLGDAVRRLRVAGVRVVVATCPDLGAVRPVPQPLRWVGHQLSKRMARTQAEVVAATGGVPVDVGGQLGRVFAARSAELFCNDRFHPSAEGYREVVGALLPAVERLLDDAFGAAPARE